MPTKTPLIFLAHGSPMNAIEQNQYTESWKVLGKSIQKPRAILMFSAHWITEHETRISSSQHPEMIYDMYGFPESLYHIHYDAPGSPEIAEEIITLLWASDPILPLVGGVRGGTPPNLPYKGRDDARRQVQPKITLDPTRGYDHGVWSTLVHMFPEQDIPVVTMSLDYHMSPRQYIELGQSIAKLREKWILIMWSGNIVHNLRAIDWNNGPAYPWATEFDARVADGLTAWKNSPAWESILEFQSWGDVSKLAHPSYDHLLPLFPLMGASSVDDRVEFLTPDITMGSLSMRSVVWG